MIEVLLLALLGIAGGIIAGLLPGLHPNTVAVLLLSLSPALLAFFPPLAIVVFIITMAISNSFLNFIPAVFLGAPEGESALSVLPGHQYLLEGKGYEAVYLTVLGGLGVVLLTILLLPVILSVLPFLYEAIRSYIAPLLLIVSLAMILGEKGFSKMKALLVFLLSGILGLLSFSPALSSQNVLFPVFTGLFGMGTLLLSSASGFSVPKQQFGVAPLARATAFFGVVKGFVSGLVVGILPGVGPSQAGVMVQQFTQGKGMREFLISLGGINAVSTLFSFMALYLIAKPRSGTAVAVERILGSVGWGEFLLIMAAAAFATGISVILTLKLTKVFSGFMEKINYKSLVRVIVLFLVVLTVLLTGPLGLLILITSTAIGLLPPLLQVKRTHAMGALMVPIILFFFGFGV